MLVRRGGFSRSSPKETKPLLADANHVLFSNRGQTYSYSHPAPGGDACTILALETSLAMELVSHHDPRGGENADAPFRLGYGLSSASLADLHYEILGLARRGATSLSIEEACVELACAALRGVYREDRQRRRVSGGAATRSRDYELAEATKRILLLRAESPPSLNQLAHSLGCSSFHLSRTFRKATGLTLRAYTKRLRARLAAERLATGEADLTALALDLGYADHSHFTNAFRQEFGMPPSRFRMRARSGK